MTALELEVRGIGAWTADHDGWPALSAALTAGTAGGPCRDAIRPTPTILPRAERRRMPDGVAVAIQVAHEAIVAAGEGIDPTSVASIFASAHGDLAIVDYLCATVASDPASLSPTRFHLSVHNAAAGYWSIARRDHAPTSAIAAGDDSFALGLVEAAALAVAEHRPVLLVVFDTPATGLLAAAVTNRALFGFAMLVAPLGDAVSGPVFALSIESGNAALPLPRVPRLHDLAMSSAAARALAFAELLVTGGAPVRYPIGRATTLSIRLRSDEPAHRGLSPKPIG